MTWLRSLQSLYSLDVLDARFTTTSSTPPKNSNYELNNNPVKSAALDVTKRDERNGASAKGSSSKPLWHTREFYFYYLVFAVAIPLMFKAVIDISHESHPNYPKFAPLLSEGWIPGRKVDNSDVQYSSIRDNLVLLLLLGLAHPLLRKAYDYVLRADSYTAVSSSSDRSATVTQGLPAEAAADARLEQRVSFDLGFAAIFIIALHGISALKILCVLYTNYSIAKKVPKAYVASTTWVFNIGLLFANEYFHGFPLRSIASVFEATSSQSDAKEVITAANWGTYLDGYGGLLPQWHVVFKCSVLRMISFNVDYVWSLNHRGNSPVEKKQLNTSNLSERDRISNPVKEDDYVFSNYVAYVLYAPLYLAGPILTFNDYITQLRYRLPSANATRTAMYALRFLFTVLCMELLQHYVYVVAICKAQPDWSTYTPFELSMLAYFNLNIIWLKLLIPWRLFRTWSLMDGIDPPENMIRCMSDNYSALAFWRSWHRSFGRWTIRYIYAPLGGRVGSGLVARVWNLANYLAVFTFVAIWHDINLRLLTWGWLVTLFMIPEIIASIAFPPKKWQNEPTKYRIICGVGAVLNILMMMAAALVGFAVGVDGLKGLVDGIVGSYSGLLYLATACGALFVGSQIMFEHRQDEMRRGIKLKC